MPIVPTTHFASGDAAPRTQPASASKPADLSTDIPWDGSLSVLYVGPMSGTSLHRRNAFARLGHRMTVIEPRKLLPASPWIDRIEWHLSPTLLGGKVARALESALGDNRFDLAFVDGGSLINAAAVRELKAHCRHVVSFNHDDPFGKRDGRRFSAYRQALSEYDLAIVVRPLNVPEAERLGARRVLLHPMVSDEVAHAPRVITPEIRAKWQSDVAFIGSWMPERGPFMLDLVRHGVPLAIFGPGWHKAPEWPQLKAHHRADYLDGDDYAYAVQCAGLSLGLLSKGNRDLHTTRSMEIPSLGGLLCAERTEEHLKFYRDGVEAVLWADSTECAALCMELLHDEPRRHSIAARGQQRFRENGYTSENLIRSAIGMLT